MTLPVSQPVSQSVSVSSITDFLQSAGVVSLRCCENGKINVAGGYIIYSWLQCCIHTARTQRSHPSCRYDCYRHERC